MFGRWLIVLLVAVCGTGASGEHPQDGPHADIRVTISDRDVRMNLGINLLFLDAAKPTGREVASVVAASEEQRCLDALRELIERDNAVVIDGIEVAPTIERLEIERLSEDSLYLFPISGRAALTRFSAVAVYPCKSAPERVDFRWAHYPASALSGAFEEVGDTPPPMVIEMQLKAEGRVTILRCSESAPVATWTASGSEPESGLMAMPASDVRAGVGVSVAMVLCLGVGLVTSGLLAWRGKPVIGVVGLIAACGAAYLVRDAGVVRVGERGPSEAQALALFSALHANVYRAFDFTDEDTIYDTLALSAEGDLLDDLYRQINRSLVQAENGGSVGLVTSLDLLGATLTGMTQDEGGVRFTVDAEWELEGTVYHFGHSHAKRSAYAGAFLVSQTPDGWRISEASSRRLDDDSDRPAEL